ncbi:MAG: ChaB family protein [Hyphomicrobiaceae bacterium]
MGKRYCSILEIDRRLNTPKLVCAGEVWLTNQELQLSLEGCEMPYASIDDLPVSVKSHLPMHAREIYRRAFNSAWAGYDDQPPDEREATAHRVAWAAVKRRYRKEADRWVER